MSVAILRQFFPDIPDDDEFQRVYDWLISDWKAMRWSVRDPGAKARIDTETYTFEGVLRPNESFSDDQDVVEDIKRSLSFSIEQRVLGNSFGKTINSLSLIRQRIRFVKRIYREIYDLGVHYLDGLDHHTMDILVERLSQPEIISRKYEQKVTDYFKDVDATDIPIKVLGEGYGNTIDRDAIYLSLGLEPEVAKGSQIIRGLMNQGVITLQEVHPNKKFTVNDDEYTGVSYVAGDSYAKEYIDLLNTLQTLSRQSDVDGLFNYPLLVEPVFEPEHYAIKYLPGGSVINTERTRNIPVESWMTIMDAAVRFVVDYADPLKEAEIEATEYFNGVARDQGSHEAGKRTVAFLRTQTYAEGEHSPFPLSAYAHYQDQSANVKWTDERLDALQEDIDSGEPPIDIYSRWGITRASYDYARKLLAERHLEKGTGLSLHRARYNFLPLCCTLILLAFTAGRETSIATLRAGCIRKEFDDLYINMFIPKTLRRYDNLPTVEIVEKAVHVLEDLSESARAETGNDLLYQFKGLKEGKVQGFRWENVIDDFLDWIGLDSVDEHDQKFKFSEHQFRRFFAMMFFYRYDAKYKLNALLRFMRHLDWNMTDVYVSEKNRGLVFKQIAEERGAEMMAAAANDDVGGNMALVLKEAVEGNFKFQHEKSAHLFLKKYQDGGYVWEFCQDGVCFGRTPGREEYSLCKLEKDAEIYVMIHRQKCGDCKGCPNLLTTNEIRVDKVEEPRLVPLVPGLKAAIGA